MYVCMYIYTYIFATSEKSLPTYEHIPSLQFHNKETRTNLSKPILFLMVRFSNIILLHLESTFLLEILK